MANDNNNYPPAYAIWNRKGKNGAEYLSMKTPTGEWITFFKARNKRSDKAPDWYQAQDQQGQGANQGGNFQKTDDDSGVPF